MTDKEHIQSIYQKIQVKYPQVTDQEEITQLAIKLDKRRTLLISGAWLLGAILCYIIFHLVLRSDTFEGLSTMAIIMTGSGVFECIRTLCKYPKIQQKYKPVLTVKHEGELTQDKILNDGKRILKKEAYVFQIFKLPLADKEDETDVGTDNETLHSYYYHFQHPEKELTMKYKVKRALYMNAVLGAEYLVVTTPKGEIAAVYQASNWTIGSDLAPYLSTPVQGSPASEVPDAPSPYQPNPIQTTPPPQKTKKLLPILALVFSVVSYLLPLIIGLPMGIAALVLAIVGLIKQKTKLSIISLVVTAVLFALLIVFIAAAF